MLTLSPPSSRASAPHSGVQAKMLSAASAGTAQSVRRRLETMRTVSPQAVDVLQHELAVAHASARLVFRELQPHPAELRRAPIEHDGVLGRVVLSHEERKVG